KGTPKSQVKSRSPLQLLRSSRHERAESQADALDSIVCNIVSNIDQAVKAKKMVQIRMEHT
ncbi:hypothetical protein BHE74_00008308, partial [Ensete ventricosum]